MEETKTGNMVRVDKDRGMETLSARETQKERGRETQKESGQIETERGVISREKRQGVER